MSASASADAGEEQVAESPNVEFTPVVTLPEVEIRTLEEDEEEIFKIRARLFRYANECSPPEWKERGTGDVRFLKKEGRSVRLLMRRDKTLKICGNHYITSKMELRPNKGSDRAWVYTTYNDFADEEATQETLAIRFANATNANLFRTAFESAQKVAKEMEDGGQANSNGEETQKETSRGEASVDETTKTTEEEKPAEATEDAATSEVTEKLEDLKVKEEAPTDAPSNDAETDAPAPSTDAPAEESAAAASAETAQD